MTAIFGVDSLYPANTKLTNGYDLYSWVMRKGGFPAFWGRSITGEDKVTLEEMEFLKEKKCKVAFYLTDLTETQTASFNGTEDALRAVEAVEALGVAKDKGIVIFAVLGDDWGINQNWMLSFAATLSNNGFAPGFIGNTDSSKNFNFNRQCGHFVKDTEKMKNLGVVFGATEPKSGKEAALWQPFYPSDIDVDKIALWQNGRINCNGISANTTYGHDESVLAYMW